MQIIPVFCATNENYAPFLCTTVFSILKHTEAFVEFHVLDGGISEKSKQLIEKSITHFKNYSIQYFDMTHFNLSQFPNLRHYSLNTFSRYFIPQLDVKYDKILYLDVDIIAKRDIASLYNHDLETYPLGAVPEDFFKNGSVLRKYIYPAYKDDSIYFNAGVLLIDLQYWRENNISEKLIKLTVEYADKIKCADQDIINIVFENNYKAIDYIYDYMPDHFSALTELRPARANFIRDNAALIHYTWKKPWRESSLASDDFWEIYEETEFFKEKIDHVNKELYEPIKNSSSPPIRSENNNNAGKGNTSFVSYEQIFHEYRTKERFVEHNVDFNGLNLLVPDAVSFAYQVKEIFMDRIYAFTSDKASPIIYDCGANIGISVLFFKELFPDSIVKAFEADDKIFEVLQKNTQHLNNITLFHNAVWINNKELSFNTEGADAGSLVNKSNGIQKVQGIRLKNLLEQEEEIDFLKIDIEGVETVVLEDCEEQLYKVKNLFVEYHSLTAEPQILCRLLEILSLAGFRYHLTTMSYQKNVYQELKEYNGMDLQINIFAYRQRKLSTSTTKNTLQKEKLSAFRNSCSEKGKLNLGCGNTFHGDWVQLDFASRNPEVFTHNLLAGIPCEDNQLDVVYHSHVLEHFSKENAVDFMKECYRVLKPNGIIRVAIPDLEQIAKIYLDKLNEKNEADYNWIMLEMYDQCIRNSSGGDMLKYFKQEEISNLDFVLSRLGNEAEGLILNCKNYHPKENIKPSEIGKFRLRGEIHQWMYDRFSLELLFKKVGFKDFKVQNADTSYIKNYNNYSFDMLNGKIRKPDSLFVEAKK